MISDGCPYELSKTESCNAYLLKYKGEVLPFQVALVYDDSATSIAKVTVTFAMTAEAVNEKSLTK